MMWLERSGLVWSKPLLIKSDWPNGLTLGPGVYRLVALDQTIRRACGDDSSATLYIGQAGALEGRVNELRKALRPEEFRSGAHGAGRLLRATRILFDRFNLETLATTWAVVSETPGDYEADLIGGYLEEFGEAPPLNRQRVIPTYD
jgi:hypothetical protein